MGRRRSSRLVGSVSFSFLGAHKLMCVFSLRFVLCFHHCSHNINSDLRDDSESDEMAMEVYDNRQFTIPFFD